MIYDDTLNSNIKKNDDEDTLFPNFDLYTSYFTGKTDIMLFIPQEQFIIV